MNWIKKNPAQFALALVSVGVLASSYLLYSNASDFSASFDESRQTPTPSKELALVDTKPLDAAKESFQKPTQWAASNARLFSSDSYVVKDGKLVRPDTEGSEPFQPPVKNSWLTKYGLDLLSNTVLDEDSDGDGFNTRLEWNGMDGLSHLEATPPYGPVMGSDGKPLPDDSTNPVDANSHPPYHTRLVLAQVENIPFRLRFMSYDIDPKNPNNVTVGINTVDRGARTHFKAIGEDVPTSKFRVEKFEKKEAPRPDGTKDDVSELTLVNKETNQPLVLPLNKVVNSPESFIVLNYDWVPKGGQKIPDKRLLKGGSFTIPPEVDKVYKVIDIRDTEVDIQLPSGEKRTLRKKK